LGDHHRLERVQVDRGGQLLSSSKLASLEMHARLITTSMPRSDSESFAVSRMSPRNLEFRVALRQEVVAEVHDVEDGDRVAQIEQLRVKRLPT
jgi:hypothetical protein